MATLHIRNLDESVKQQLRVQAARHGRSMEAEARRILATAVTGPQSGPTAEPDPPLRGIWKNRLTTDDIMALTRAE